MNIAFFGSPEIAATVLKELISSDDTTINIALVVTKSDKPAGKKLDLQKTKVKELAENENIPVFDKDIRQAFTELRDMIKSKDIDLAVVCAYGEYLPIDLVNLPKDGFINIHFSLLPKYRGASPIAYPLILGEKETGVTLIKLNEELDGGDIISQTKIDILDNENRIELEKRLTGISIPMTLRYITDLASQKKILFQSQKKSEVTITRLIKKNDGYITLSVLKKSLMNELLTPDEIPSLVKEYVEKYPHGNDSSYYQNSGLLLYNYYRGLYKWPGIWTTVSTLQGEKRLKLTHVSISSNNLRIDRVQLEGKNEVDFLTFNKAYKIF